MALVISTWLWGSKYPDHYVERLRAGVARHLAQPYEFKVFSPEPEDEHLTRIPGCLARLRMWSKTWQAVQGLKRGDRLVTLDLDLIVTGSLDSLFDRTEPFVILQGANTSNPCPFNGSVQMLKVGYRPDVWDDFSLEAVKASPKYEFHDDQGWLSYKLPGAAGWQVGEQSGIYAYAKRGWTSGDRLPDDARIVAFPGKRDPAMYQFLPWVAEHWRT